MSLAWRHWWVSIQWSSNNLKCFLFPLFFPLNIEINSSHMNTYAKSGHDLHPNYCLMGWNVSSLDFWNNRDSEGDRVRLCCGSSPLFYKHHLYDFCRLKWMEVGKKKSIILLLHVLQTGVCLLPFKSPKASVVFPRKSWMQPQRCQGAAGSHHVELNNTKNSESLLQTILLRLAP